MWLLSQGRRLEYLGNCVISYNLLQGFDFTKMIFFYDEICIKISEIQYVDE